MTTTIIIRRGTAAPTQASGLTLGEPAFNTTDQTLHIGRGAGVTAAWVGARITGLSADIAAGLTLQIPTSSAVKNYITDYVAQNTSGVSSITVNGDSLDGPVTLLGGSQIGITSNGGDNITITNNGVRTIGVSGTWRTSSVVVFGGATGGITLSGTTWSGNSTPQLNSNQLISNTYLGGITAGTVLTGKTPMEILELMLVTYLNPTLASLAMGFVNASGGSQNSLAFGMTADNDTSTVTWSTTNGTNIANGATLSVSLSSLGVTGTSGNLLTTAQITSATAGSYAGFNPAIKYRGFSLASSSAAPTAAFTLSARDTQGNSISTTQTYAWYPRIFYGWSTDPGLTFPPDAWKRQNVLSGLTTGSLMTTINSTNPNYSFILPAPATDSYLYFWIHNNFVPGRVMDATSGGNQWALTTDTNGTLVSGITLDDGVNTQSYRRYRSQYTQVGAVTVFLTSA